ncbi:hypothetical protein [Falsirhodobacter deserti]|uniref:hypothetical protein n=1 Tax=Falsirhodobacter deserti TaxID=1365611 RepID=UPI000FE3ECEF|nr:hypothetical protein [Falsirhodobacter deserti]
MPQADLYFTTDHKLEGVLPEIERTIATFDGAAGQCKGRAHPVADHHHSHVLLRLSMLPKPHRDDAYAAELGKKLAEVVRPHVTAPSAVAVNISFDLVHYTAIKVE